MHIYPLKCLQEIGPKSPFRERLERDHRDKMPDKKMVRTPGQNSHLKNESSQYSTNRAM